MGCNQFNRVSLGLIGLQGVFNEFQWVKTSWNDFLRVKTG